MRHILTVGVEDFFHADAFGQLIQPRIWSRFERRLERSTRAALDLCDETGAKATFFVLGWIAEVAPELVREIAAREVERARAGHLPTVDVVASHGVNNRLQLSSERNEITSIGLELNLPLYAGGRVSSVSREAAALRVKADADLEDARRGAALAARESWLGVTSGMAQVKALEAAKLSSTSAAWAAVPWIRAAARGVAFRPCTSRAAPRSRSSARVCISTCTAGVSWPG